MPLLPDPQGYDTWQEWAAAVNASLDEVGLTASVFEGVLDPSQLPDTIPTGNLPAVPEPLVPLWWDPAELAIFFGNPDYTPPEPFDLFMIDTGQIANASIETSKIALGAVTQGIIQDGAVVTAKLQDAVIVTAKIADAAIVSAKIGDLQVVTAKINDLAVNTGKIANLAVDNAKINDLAVSTAKIQLLAVNAALIANLAVGAAKIADATIITAKIADAQITTAKIALANITTALISNAAITNALIANLAVGTANIADAAIASAKIADAAITTAKIGDAQIVNAKIADATIVSAKIASLIIDKITAGTLNAEIDMGTGLIRFTIGGNRLTIGKGFGTSSQFIMWFGPSMAESAMSEASAVFYLKTNGSAYFGGSILAGTLTNSVQSSSTAPNDVVETGDFGSNGGSRVYTCSYSWSHYATWASGTRSITGTPSATIVIEKADGLGGWTVLATQTFNGQIDLLDQIGREYSASNSGSFQYTDNTGGSGPFNVRARITSRTDPTLPSTYTFIQMEQRLGITTVEQ